MSTLFHCSTCDSVHSNEKLCGFVTVVPSDFVALNERERWLIVCALMFVECRLGRGANPRPSTQRILDKLARKETRQ